MSAALVDMSGVLGEEGAPPTERVSPMLPFPTEGLRLQDIITKLLLEGKAVEEIAELVGRPVELVEKVISTEFVAKALENAVHQVGDDDAQHSVRNLLRGAAPKAVLTAVQLLRCTHPPTQLSAAKLILEYTLIPAKERDVVQAKKNIMQGLTPERMQDELARVKGELEKEKGKKRL